MRGQLKKLLVLLNACWWLALSFFWWRYASSLPKAVVSSVVALAVLAVLANATAIAWWLWPKKLSRPPTIWWFQALIVCSFAAQLVVLLYYID
jgi:hypothetical protein